MNDEATWAGFPASWALGFLAVCVTDPCIQQCDIEGNLVFKLHYLLSPASGKGQAVAQQWYAAFPYLRRKILQEFKL